MQNCRSCGADIIWAIWPRSGRRAPFDATPVLGGNVLLDERTPPRAAILKANPDVRAYVSHFATCPHADLHRQREVDEPVPAEPSSGPIVVKLRRLLGVCFLCGDPATSDYCRAHSDLSARRGR